ncbi:MAG: alpha-amylase family glycosyl hydrolase [Mucilaginibacter sp.]
MRINDKLTTSGLIVLILLAVTSCSKSHVTPPPVKTNPDTTTYKDPAQYGTPFANVPATKDMVIYEVNLRTYTPGTFSGALPRLDSVKALGVNVIWLMPTYPIGVLKSVGSPYCVKDYTGVNSDLGTLSDLRAYVAKAHSLGMAVIMDWVANHTSWDNAWITNKSWYLQDGSGNIIYPPGTNYQDVAALNYSNTDMRKAMIRAMKYWVFTANIDGYRCDFADNVTSNFWAQAIDTLNTIKTHKLIYLAEGTAASEISAGFQIDFAFSYYSTLKSVYGGTQGASSIFTTNSNELSSIPSTGTKLRYITNHDDASSDGSTLTIYKSKQGALSAFALAAYMGGIPMIYDSQEVGYPNPISIFTDVPVDYTANPDIVAAYKQILAFRAAHEAVKTGALTPYADPNMVVFEKVSGNDDVLVLVNPTGNVINYILPAALQNSNWKSGINGFAVSLGTQLSIMPYQYTILSKN